MKSIHLLALFCYPTGRFPNNDGFDPESCINVTLVNSRIDVADDGICPKAAAGKGPLKGLYVRNVSVRHVHTKSQKKCPVDYINLHVYRVSVRYQFVHRKPTSESLRTSTAHVHLCSYPCVWKMLTRDAADAHATQR